MVPPVGSSSISMVVVMVEVGTMVGGGANKPSTLPTSTTGGGAEPTTSNSMSIAGTNGEVRGHRSSSNRYLSNTHTGPD